MAIVTIRCTAKGVFTYGGAEHLRVKRGDDVDWTSPSGAFGIHFERNQTPVLNRGNGKPMPRGRAPKNRKLKGRVRPRVAKKSYKYFVAVYRNRKIFTDDPDIIVY